MANADHERFWAPVAERIFAAILEAKHMSDDPSVKGCVFVLWGTVAQKLRKVIERVNVHNVPVRFVETFNPAAQGDIFQNDNSFQMINACLEELGMQVRHSSTCSVLSCLRKLICRCVPLSAANRLAATGRLEGCGARRTTCDGLFVFDDKETEGHSRWRKVQEKQRHLELEGGRER